MGESFSPHSDTRKLYRVYLLIPSLVFAVSISFCVAALMLYVESPWSWIAASILIIPFLVVVGFVIFWIPRYLSTVTFTLAEDRIVFHGGLWWKRKSLVPYNRITNIDIFQGPLSRRYGLGKVSIQTAGYSGQVGSAGRIAEIAILGVKDFEASTTHDSRSTSTG